MPGNWIRGGNRTHAVLKKGCAERIAPLCTLSQNGYGTSVSHRAAPSKKLWRFLFLKKCRVSILDDVHPILVALQIENPLFKFILWTPIVFEFTVITLISESPIIFRDTDGIFFKNHVLANAECPKRRGIQRFLFSRQNISKRLARFFRVRSVSKIRPMKKH